jgi:peroxiredoxin
VDQQIDLNIDKEISSFYLSDIDGEIRSDKDGEGKKAMILAIFSGDTEPSKRMLPLINEFYENLEKPEKKKLLLYGIYEGEIENIKEFKEDWALDFPVLIDAEKKLAEPSDELPIVVGLDEHRLIKFYEEGYNLNIKAILQDFISKY